MGQLIGLCVASAKWHQHSEILVAFSGKADLFLLAILYCHPFLLKQGQILLL